METQKARGILIGLDYLYEDWCLYNDDITTIDHTLITDIKQINDIYVGNGVFARPCPTTPRHGFVDSRVVKSKEGLVKLFKEIKRHDPGGELLICKKINADFSAVMVGSGLLSVGRSNDGATSGKGSVSIPIAPFDIPNHTSSMADIKKDEVPYIEVVHKSKITYLTQLRAGPKLTTSSPDFIPEDVKVKKVVYPIDDLLQWEQKVKTFKPGTVVYGNGHTLASHAAIHCVINNIPFVCSYKPKVGQRLSKQDKKVKLSRDLFKKGVRAGLNICKKRVGHAEETDKLFLYSVSVLHNWAQIKNSENAAWILGSASAILAKISASLVVGEFRHYPAPNGKISSRQKIYKKVLGSDTKYFSQLPKIFESFYSSHWTEGFGGVPWAICAWYANKLWRNIAGAFNNKSGALTDTEVSDIVSVINKVITLDHNNGWWFDKVVCVETYDMVARTPHLGMLKSLKAIYSIYTQVKRADVPKRKLSSKKAYCPADLTGSPKWIKVFPVSIDDKIHLSYLSNSSCPEATACVKATPKETNAIKKLFLNNKNKAVYLKTRDGAFTIPGSNRVLSINNVF